MLEDIERAAAELANRNAGWVLRRDAAEVLAKAAARAVGALEAHAQDPDVDVREVVQRALARFAGAQASGAPGAEEPPRSYSIEALAQACAKPGEREVERNGDGFSIEATLKDGRHQTVYLMPFKRNDGVALIRVYTFCGAARGDIARWALETNMKLAQCAFALMKDEDREQLILLNSFLADGATPREIKSAVKEIAYYGDWVEQKQTGHDDF